METRAPETLALQATGLTKRYGNGVLANDGVDFELKRGEVHALLGENGAGKSTLVKCFYGLVQPDAGEVHLQGRSASLVNSAAAIAAGIGMVHQELMLIPYMTVAENVTLGKEVKKRGGRLDMKRAEQEIRKLSDEYGFDIDPGAQVGKLPIGVQQRVEIIKLLYRHADILILDEPTALLTPQESDSLFEVVNKLKSQGKSIIFITHKLKEVYQIADRMTVMRGGRRIITTTPQETDEKALTELMVGKSVERLQRNKREISGDVVLSVEDLQVSGSGHRNLIDGVSFEIRAGEILGVAGIEGNGQTQLAQGLFGHIHTAGGEIRYAGQSIRNHSTREIRSLGVGSIPDDRQGMGLILNFNIAENIILNEFAQKPYAKNWAWQRWGEIHRHAGDVVQEFDIRTAGVSAFVSALSGGNQQKVVVGRELSVPLKLLIASQPTRGVDFNSAEFIQRKILEAAGGGTAVLLFSSDLDELLNISDRIMVLHRGRNAGIVGGGEATKEQLGSMMLGLHKGG